MLTSFHPGGGETISPPPMAVRFTAMAKLQAASVPIAYAAAPWDRQTDRQTDGSRCRLMPPPYGGDIIRCRRENRQILWNFAPLSSPRAFPYFAVRARRDIGSSVFTCTGALGTPQPNGAPR